jgi:hypothetical protein
VLGAQRTHRVTFISRSGESEQTPNFCKCYNAASPLPTACLDDSKSREFDASIIDSALLRSDCRAFCCLTTTIVCALLHQMPPRRNPSIGATTQQPSRPASPLQDDDNEVRLLPQGATRRSRSRMSRHHISTLSTNCSRTCVQLWSRCMKASAYMHFLTWC